jgi:amidase
VKDSYSVRGLSLSSGSPAFMDLVATGDAFVVERLRAAGAIVLGRTTMPPMANGGMQRGLHGRAESPYNAEFLTAAFGSGSSNGSGTATAASFAAFGMGGETWSSGRAPASNNGLVAYTPSRGLIPQRGAWPLVPTMDVLVPHTRSVADLLEVLDVIVADDTTPRGDFWRVQPWVDIPAASSLRPSSYRELETGGSLRGCRLGVPRMYINADRDATTKIETRASVIALWEHAKADLEALGATVVEVDFPIVSNLEADRAGTESMVDRGFVPEEYAHREIWDLSMFSWDDFLAANGQPGLSSLAETDGELLFPAPAGSLPDRYGDDDFDLARYASLARTNGITPLEQIPTLEAGLRGLEQTRRVDLEDWMTSLGLDAIVFPAVADVGPADSDVNEASADLAWRNGTWVANGNRAVRLFGIPTVTVPMGLMDDIHMPAGLTFAGRAYDDVALLKYAGEFESVRQRRIAPPLTPPLIDAAPSQPVSIEARSTSAATLDVDADVSDPDSDGLVTISVHVTATATADIEAVSITVNGVDVSLVAGGDSYGAIVTVEADELTALYSEWLPPHPVVVTALVRDSTGSATGAIAFAAAPE